MQSYTSTHTHTHTHTHLSFSSNIKRKEHFLPSPTRNYPWLCSLVLKGPFSRASVVPQGHSLAPFKTPPSSVEKSRDSDNSKCNQTPHGLWRVMTEHILTWKDITIDAHSQSRGGPCCSGSLLFYLPFSLLSTQATCPALISSPFSTFLCRLSISVPPSTHLSPPPSFLETIFRSLLLSILCSF